MLRNRASGILLHPSSLPSRGGIGDLGPAAYDFIDFLVAAKQTLWQVLPLNPLGIGNSPYSSTSAFAGNVLLISLERLADRGLLPASKVKSLPDGTSSVDYDSVRKHKLPLLTEAASNFIQNAKGSERERFEKFKWENGWWLEDFVLFDALRRRYKDASWNKWPRELAKREAAALEKVRTDIAEELMIGRFLQFAFFEQWRALHEYCRHRNIRIVGDVAIFVSYDSADVWTHPEVFRLRADLEPEAVAGVPPDAFSETGQRWGNPLYRWDALRDRGYDWWVQRIRWSLMTCDIIRLDHFRAFQQYWEIPADEPTAVHGRWVDGPKDDLFRVLRENLGDLPFIAEDLGMITEDVHALRRHLQIPGMRVLQFGFGDRGAHMYLPHKYEANTVVYTGTHDNDTTPGWWQNSAAAHEREFARDYLGEPKDGMHWAMIRAAEGSIANMAIVPLQDVLGLGSEARMNVPSQGDGNWTWRYKAADLTAALAKKLAAIVEISDRDDLALTEEAARALGREVSAIAAELRSR
jgi:4-alpha-glucanotransferase